MLTPGVVPFYPAERLWSDAQVRSNMILCNMLLNVREIPDQFLVSFYCSEMLKVTGSLTAVFIVLVHNDAVDEMCFRKSLEQMEHAVMGDTKQFGGCSKLDEFLGRHLLEETPSRHHDLSGVPEPVHLFLAFYKGVGHGKSFIKEIGAFRNACGLQQQVIPR